MGFAFIREGDTTSHGGRVLTCTSTNTIDGKPLALLGDMVSCPKCEGTFPIVSTKQLNMTFGGRPVASEGDKTACGATLIATQNSSTGEVPAGPLSLTGQPALSASAASGLAETPTLCLSCLKAAAQSGASMVARE